MDKLYWLLIASVAIVISGSMVIFHLESGQSDSQINSRLDAAWWAVSTITTVGYGDIVPVTDSAKIPDWVRHTAKWWSLTQISDQDFAKGLEYLVQQQIIQVPENQPSEGASESELPSWLRKNAGWWSQGLLSDDEFFKSIQWLINNGFIKII